MRRFAVCAVMAVAVLAACGGGGSKTSTSAGATSSGGSSGNVHLTGNFCGDGKSAVQNGAFANSSGTSSATLQKAVDQLKKISSEAPSEIKGDVNTVVNFLSQSETALSSAGNDPAKMQAALAPLQGQEANVTAASQRIDAYITAHCK